MIKQKEKEFTNIPTGIYEGQFKYDKREGKKIYEGEFRNDKRE